LTIWRHRAISHVSSMGDVKQGSRSDMQGIFAGACPVALKSPLSLQKCFENS
jgi:hypothetical protein